MWFRVKEGKWSQPLLSRVVATLELEANSQHLWSVFLLPMNLFPENGTTTLRQSSSLFSINTLAHLQYSLRIQVHPKEGITQPESDDEIGTVKPLPRMGLHSWGFTHSWKITTLKKAHVTASSQIMQEDKSYEPPKKITLALSIETLVAL